MQSATAGTSSRSGASKTRTRRKSRRKRKLKSQQAKQEKFRPTPAVPVGEDENQPGLELWRETYDNIVRWQTKHQTSYWRNAAEQLRLENAELKRQLQKIERNGQPETSSGSDSDDEEVPVDAKYLKFMEITQQHRADLKLKKEQEESGS